MRLRTALDAHKRDDGPFPGTRSTHGGAFAGHGPRLVHVAPDGSLRDCSAALSGLHGIDRSRLGVAVDGEVRWFDAMARDGQRYHGDTAMVVTEHDAGNFGVRQLDCTLGRTHVTRVELGRVDGELVAALGFAPDGRETGVGRLDYRTDDGNVTEIYGPDERDYVAAHGATVRGQPPESFEQVLADDSTPFPRENEGDRYEATRLSGDVVVRAPLERGVATLVTHLANEGERADSVRTVRGALERYDDLDSLREAAAERAPVGGALTEEVTTDLRALSLLQSPAGGHVAGPEFDPFYVSSGGYGYVWFRDGAEVARRLLVASERLDLPLDDRLTDAAEFLVDAQLDDGSWPHRVWGDGTLAPGWANARVEGHDGEAYQADQTASAVAFLATLLRERPDLTSVGARVAVEDGLAILDATLGGDSLPRRCQNLWENAHGRFVHTAATYLQAYAEASRLRVGDGAGAETVLDGLDRLWTGTHYGLGLVDGDLDDRLDAGSLALVDAFAAYEAVSELSDADLDRLVNHVETALDGLYRETDAVAGLVRFEDDEWRTPGQDGEKVWSVATAWGADAAARLADLLDQRGRDGARFRERARELYALVGADGPFTNGVGFLAEQLFDDGRLDSATPLAWSHALRLSTAALLEG